MKRIIQIILIAVVISLIAPHSSPAQAAVLSLSVSLDKDEYKPGEPIPAAFKLKNKGNKPLYVNKRFFLSSQDSRKDQREIFLIVTSPSGEKLPCKVSYETGLPKSDYFVLLGPREEVSSERKRNLAAYFDFQAPGLYTITAVYQNTYGPEIGLDTHKGEIRSSPVKIRIEEEKQ